MKKLIPFLILIAAIACKSKKNDAYFEGTITLEESRGLYGGLFKVNTTYTISENYIKREQKLGGLNSIAENYAGVIVDLLKDSITLYYYDKLGGKKYKHITTITQYNANQLYKNKYNSLPTPIDQTFRYLPNYNLIKQVKDSTVIKNFKADYTLYRDNSKILQQEIFDTKEVKVKREMLELVFADLPKEINFILKSELKTALMFNAQDSIMNPEQTQAVNGLLRDVFNKKDSAEADIDKIANNKWIKLGLKVLKKGIDLNFHVTTNVADVVKRKTSAADFTLPLADFEELSNFEDFVAKTVRENHSSDFDD